MVQTYFSTDVLLQRSVTILGLLPVSWYGRPTLRNVKPRVDLWGRVVIPARAFNSCERCTVRPGVSPYHMGGVCVNATARLGGRLGNCPYSVGVDRLGFIVPSTANEAIRKPLPTLPEQMADLTRIPDLTEAEFSALFYLFHEGLSKGTGVPSHAVMGALHALQSAQRVTVKLPGES